MDLDQVIIISIEGLIGAGKSTLVSFLKDIKLEDTFFVNEPVEEFQTFYHFNPLETQKLNPFATQLHIIRCLKKQYNNLIEKSNGARVIITDRCLNSSIVFIDTLYRTGCINDFEKKLLETIVQETKDEIKLVEPDAIFFLTASPEVCHQRALFRNRVSELDNISNDYLNKLNESYLKYFVEKCKNIVTFSKNDITKPEELVLEFTKFVKNLSQEKNSNLVRI